MGKRGGSEFYRKLVTGAGQRRRFLLGAAAAALAPSSFARQPQAPSVGLLLRRLQEFSALSEWVTGQADLPATTAKEHFFALWALDRSFPQDVGKLASIARRCKPGDIETLAAQAARVDKPLREALDDIASAWYLGWVNDGEKSTLVTFETALMHRPVDGFIAPVSHCSLFPDWSQRPEAIERK